MFDSTERILESFEAGLISRREAALRLTAMALALAGVGHAQEASPKKPTFQATGLNHIALRVTDVARSRDFYQEHLGLEVLSDEAPGTCFMSCGENYVGLFRSTRPRMDHYCYELASFRTDRELARATSAGLRPRQEQDRVYFDDPDGLTIQLAGKWNTWPGPLPEER